MASMSSWDDRSLRRSFVHMQDAGQARAFFVKLVGEGVDDQGGPYRAAFQTAIQEEAPELLNLLVPSPNGLAEVGDNRDKHMFSLSLAADPTYAQAYVHLGKLVGMACRHRILAPLSLPGIFWKALVGESLDTECDLQSIDVSTANALHAMEMEAQALALASSDTDGGDLDLDNPNLDTEIAVTDLKDLLVQALTNSAADAAVGSEQRLFLTNSMARRIVERQSVAVVLKVVRHLRLVSQEAALKLVTRGLCTTLPTELFALFTSRELETVLCGVEEVDVEVLRRAAVYESVSPNDPHITFFWEALERMDSEERASFVNFCSGRSRLPSSASDFPMNFKLTAPPPHSESAPDNYLPIARTCFFTLSLPKYSSADLCLEKLRYAISNTGTGAGAIVTFTFSVSVTITAVAIITTITNITTTTTTTTTITNTTTTTTTIINTTITTTITLELMDADFIDRRNVSGWENVRT